MYAGVYVLYTTISNDLDQALKLLERQALIIAMPLIVFSSNLNENRISIFIRTYLFLMLIVALVAIVLLVDFLHNYEEWINFMNNKNGNLTYVQFKFPHLMGTHPTYWGYLLVIANILLLNNKTLNFFKKERIVIFLLLVFNINLFYLSARTPILINVVIHVITFFYYYGNSKSNKKKLILYSSVFLIIFSISLLQPLMAFKLSAIFNDDRFYLWPKAFDVISSNYFVLGEGLGAGNNVLKEYIFDITDRRSNYFGVDLHNQYLNNYLNMGILGFLSLIYIVTFPILVSVKCKKHKLLSLSIASLFFLCMMTESTLNVIKGIVIFSVFSSVLIKNIIDSKQKTLFSNLFKHGN